jgi:TonB dependent receptor
VGAYMQDDWKVTRKLTLNLGLRYEYFTPKMAMADQYNNWVPGVGYMTPNGEVGSSDWVWPNSQMSVGQNLAPGLQALLNADNVQTTYTANRRLSTFPKANWSPRFGASYQIDDKTVGRIGAGVFMGGFEPGGGAALTQSPPYVMESFIQTLPTCANGAYCESEYAFNNTLEGGFGGFLAAGGVEQFASSPGIMTQDPVMKMPYTMNFNMSVQRAITPTTTVTAAYVGSLGRHLVTGLSGPNMPMAITTGSQEQQGTNRAPHFTGNAWMTWAAGSSYNALQVTAQKHYGRGLSFLGTYAWGHAFDNETDLLGGDIGGYKQAQLIPIQYEWGQSGYDIRERLVANVDYDLPFGVGRQFLNHPGILDRIIGGWKTDMEWWGQTGQPGTAGINRSGTDQYGNGYGNVNGGISNNAIKVGNPFSTSIPVPSQTNAATESGITGCPSTSRPGHALKTRVVWYNACAFIDPPGDTAAASTLAPYENGTFSYFSPAVGADPAYYDGTAGPNGPGTATIGQNGKAASASNPAVPAPYVNAFADVIQFFGNRKNDVSGPGNWRLNSSLFKDFKAWREQYVEFRADAFNLLNHPSWGNPSYGTNPGSGAQITGPNSLQTNTIDSRTFQLSAKYVF